MEVTNLIQVSQQFAQLRGTKSTFKKSGAKQLLEKIEQTNF
jgi:hypothetical protein